MVTRTAIELFLIVLSSMPTWTASPGPKRFPIFFPSRDRVSVCDVFCCCFFCFATSRVVSSLVIASPVFVVPQPLPSFSPLRCFHSIVWIKVQVVFNLGMTHNRGGSSPLLHLFSLLDAVQTQIVLNGWPKTVNVHLPELLVVVWVSKFVHQLAALICLAVWACDWTISTLS